MKKRSTGSVWHERAYRRPDEQLPCPAVADALVDAAHRATWPDSSLLVELDDTVIRTQLVPHLLAALHRTRVDDRRERLS